MDKIALAAYQTEWVNRNKLNTTTKTHPALYLVPITVWATCIIVFFAGYDPGLVPAWVTNVAWGMCLLLSGLVMLLVVVSILGCFAGVATALKLSVDVETADSVDEKEAAKESYANKKHEMANKLSYTFGTKQQVKFALLVVQTVLLFAGQAYYTGAILFGGVLFIMFLGFIERTAVRTTVEKIITPEKIGWLETRVLTADEVKVERVAEFERGVEEIGKLIPPKK